ncbi:hypothetical protein JMN32_19780 [Fulvivirga sp. 29W222]|uniref:Uncharacterized protein n=1 Tax=Fulvivirga marina TaxID=2494733 RepID=A0A937KCW9_9BACT|nr:hypothetical protein [Fulvivirga marina]MBL6448561.1 hypothetical protein [Fulvivirga marina]
MKRFLLLFSLLIVLGLSSCSDDIDDEIFDSGNPTLNLDPPTGGDDDDEDGTAPPPAP